MPHHSLIATIVAGIGLAFVFGAIANRLRLSPLVGYLLAGVLIGPFTPGYVADQGLANQLAEIGVILLMFGVGLHFSLSELLAVRTIAVPGALGQMALVTLLGFGMAQAMGWSAGAGLVFGLALSVASTVVVLRALQERRLIDTERGKIAVGWLIVEDLAMVLALVLLPAAAGLLGGKAGADHGSMLVTWLGLQSVWAILGVTLFKVAAFVAVMMIVGRRVIPAVLHWVAHGGSRELFRLAVLAIALGVAFGSAELFGVSFALGAFFAGMILAESTLSQQAARETLPLRDAFAVLFFVSVGMLFDPMILVRNPVLVLGAFLVVVVGNAAAAFAIVKLSGRSWTTALTMSAALSQIGEFSFILTGLGVELDLLPAQGRDLVMAAALLSILANPLLFQALDRLGPWIRRREGEGTRAADRAGPAAAAGATAAAEAEEEAAHLPTSALAGHAVLVGYGRVGSLVGERLLAKGQKLLVIEERDDVVEALRARGVEAIAATAAQEGILAAANIAQARWLISAIPNPFENGILVEQGRGANPALEIIARAHSQDEVDYLQRHGADLIIVGEAEIARGMTEHIESRLEGVAEATPVPGAA
ncbi:Kef family K(+) transporter [Alsobacter sp. SYSU M60028]|uniref:Kef family K(+) transporter n=1 Tax=Alsobacter ponti TaxID=2962936 RepID=A0ABT1LHC8_9HYPH|nr:YbaL family putative K(+) efflux transporter [Alsobacter ponti]MCP8940904.1 Kef family K(+) transporter [Alsobacter ponti]